MLGLLFVQVFLTSNSDFQGEWTTCDADTEWIDMNYEHLYFIEEVIGVPVGDFDDYITDMRKGGYFEFGDVTDETVASFYCECHKPLSFYSFMFGNQVNPPYPHYDP